MTGSRRPVLPLLRFTSALKPLARRSRPPDEVIAKADRRGPSVLNLRLGDVLRLRRPHPCNSITFEVVRLGADIGLRCTTCNKRILLARSLLERRMAGFVTRAADAGLPTELDPTLDAPDPPSESPETPRPSP